MPLAQSTKTALDIITAVKRQFGDESGTQITDTDIFRWLNQGQVVICNRGEVNKTSIVTSAVAGQDTYTYGGWNIFKILAVQYDSKPLQNVSFEQVQATLASVDPTIYKDIPQVWYEFDDSIILYPAPSSTGGQLRIFAVLAPTQIAVSGSLLSVPDTHFDTLLSYVLKQAYELDDDFNSAGVKGAEMEQSMEALMNTASYPTYSTITVLDDDL